MKTLAPLGLVASLATALVAAIVAITSPAAAKVPISRADRNHDGIVTYEEACRVVPQLMEVQYLKADSNVDGVIDRGEYPLLDSFYGYVVNR